MNRIISLSDEDKYIKYTGEAFGATGSHNAVTLRMTFGPAWEGTAKTAYFTDALGNTSVALVLGQSLSKSKKTSTSNWSARTLSPGQIRYAATDAHGPAVLYPALPAWEAAQPPVPTPRRRRGAESPDTDGRIST